MSEDGLNKLIQVGEVLTRFISRSKSNHVMALMCVAELQEATLVDVAKAVGSTPEATRRVLDKLGKGPGAGRHGDKLVEKCRLEDRPGLFYRLSARGRIALEEIAAAFEEPKESFEWSPCDGEDGEMHDAWMGSRDLVRG